MVSLHEALERLWTAGDRADMLQYDGEWVRWVAHIDEDGFLSIDGRADDMILRGGFKVAPETVAAALRSHEAVADSSVLGVAGQRLGEVPVHVYVVDELPRGTALKVDRRRLTELLDEIRDRPPVPSAKDLS